MTKIGYAGYRFPPVIIEQAVWLYARFTLSFRDVEDLLAERGIMVSYETVRRWVKHFGPMIAADLRRRQIARDTGNDLIVQVKDNQPSLLRRFEDIAATTAPIAIDDSRNLARNRQEDRSVAVYFPGSALDDTEWEPLVAAVVRVERNTLIRSAATGQWTTRQETAFYASSVTLPAKTFASAIRNHWAIENQNHWVRDVTLAEDASRIRINPGIMARLRSQALNIARANGVTNIAEALWIAAIDPSISLPYSGL